MKQLKIILVFSGCIIVQIQLSSASSAIRAVPVQLLLIALVYFCLDYDWFGGLMAGITAGALLDINSGGHLGVYTLSYGIVGLLIGTFQTVIFKEELFPRMLIIFSATLVLQILNYQISQMYQSNMVFLECLYKYIFPGAFINCAVAIPFLILVKNKIKGDRSWSRGRIRG